MSVLFVAAIPLAGGAVQTPKQQAPTYVDPVLLAKAHTDPKGLTKMIIQSSENVSDAQKAFEWAAREDQSLDREHVKDQFRFVDSVAVTLKAGKVLELAKHYPGLTITSDAPLELAGTVTPTSKHLWPAAENIRPFYPQTEQFRATTPAIAVIDSGIDKNRSDFDMGSRVIAEKVFTTLQPNSPGDGRGHGTFVAGIAAGNAPDNAGAAPAANLVSLDVMNDYGYARTSDVIAACEWLYQNHAQYNVKVVNLSLHSTTPSNFTKDPLDKAVEKLWFAGVAVVVASGNYGNANGPSGVPFAPGNDPFVITVGAVDLEDSANARKHDIADWSAYGYTKDGFRKPEIAAAGRFVIGPVPINSTLPLERPEHVVAPGYMRLSGTSFAAPIVAGAAAQILARHPTFTPDMVKGALMQKARFIPEAPPGSAGVGEINAQRSADVKQPPNPNLALERFVIPDVTTGGTSSVFDAASWSDVAKNSAAWDAASWSDASWSDVSWSDASWSDVSWSDVSWSDVSWSDVLAAADVTREDAAGGDNTAPSNDYELSGDDLTAIAADPDLAPMPPPPPPPIALP
ncbi:MAG TPA: S8 family serine peptidase [Gaiellaceae bacterium]|nr:S8 family serine peptidase [Gaiellaceae bacterium]